MYINSIILENFRNYEKQEISLNENINIIHGNNAQGKTNIIEAIFLCAYGKSFRAKKDSDLIRFNEKEANSVGCCSADRAVDRFACPDSADQ